MVVVINYVCFHPTMVLDGFEKLRIVKPIEKVYILYDNKSDRYGHASRRNAGKLAKWLEFFKPIRIPINPQSYENVFSRLFAILYRECILERREVYIDVTDLPPEAVSAVTTLALMFKGVNVYVVTTSREKRGNFIPHPESPKFEEWLEKKDDKRGLEPVELQLPKVRLKLLSEDEKEISERILVELYKRGGEAGSIKDLIEWCGESPSIPAVKNRYSRLIDSLVRKGFLYKAYRGRERPVYLTDFGKVYASALLKAAETVMGRVQALRKVSYEL